MLAVALALPGLALGRGGRLGRALALFSLAAGRECGLIWWKAERAGGATLAHAEVVRFTTRIERVEPLPARESIRLTLHPLSVLPGSNRGPGAGAGLDPRFRRRKETLPPHIRLTVPQENAVAGLLSGAMLSARARLASPPSAAVPGVYDYSAVAWFAGIGRPASCWSR